MRNDIQIANQSLDALKKHVIGVFMINGNFELIINYKEETIDTIHITNFGIIQEGYNIPKHYGKVFMFESGKTMADVLRNPFKWAEYVEQFYTK